MAASMVKIRLMLRRVERRAAHRGSLERFIAGPLVRSPPTRWRHIWLSDSLLSDAGCSFEARASAQTWLRCWPPLKEARDRQEGGERLQRPSLASTSACARLWAQRDLCQEI